MQSRTVVTYPEMKGNAAYIIRKRNIFERGVDRDKGALRVTGKATENRQNESIVMPF